MKIVMVNTCDIQGGAARAAYRLHKGLLGIGESSRMLVHQKDSIEQTVYMVKPIHPSNGTCQQSHFSTGNNSMLSYISKNRTDLSSTLFSIPYPGLDISALALIQSADIINLHWIAQFQSPVTLHKLFKLKKPVVWTLHDQWAFTGGCHYSAGCEGYTDNCSNCPQLKNNLFGIPSTVLEDKIKLFANANLTIVTPSHWLSGCAKKSKLFKKLRIETIPYSLETDVFAPLPIKTAKQKLGISEQVVTLLFGAVLATEKRKGFNQLIEAINFCLKNSKFQDLVRKDLIKVLCFGIPSDKLKTLPIDTVSLGYLTEDEKISEAYSATDIYVLPTMEDNLPNTLLESMSCGTPVIAFNVGGIPDVLSDGETGLLVPPGNSHKLGEAILDLIFNADLRNVMGKKCRQMATKGFSLDIQAQRYLGLYKELIKDCNSTSQTTLKNVSIKPYSTREKNPITVNIETAPGPNSQDVYVQLLYEVLNEDAKDMKIIEADSAARLEVINDLAKRCEQSEADGAARLEVINDLAKRCEQSEADGAARLEVINDLAKRCEQSEADGAARLEVINDLAKRCEQSEAKSHRQAKHIAEKAKEFEVTRATGLKMINDLQEKHEQSKTDCAAKLKVIERQSKELEEMHNSLSLRMTAPFRKIFNLLRSLKR